MSTKYLPKTRFIATCWIVAVLAIGYGIGAGLHYMGGTGETAAAEPVNQVSSDAALEPISDPEDGSQVYALHWSTDDQLWYVRSSPQDQIVLVRFDTGSEESSQWTVPFSEGQTPHTYLTEDVEGLLWIGTGYSLAAFDPSSESFRSVISLDKESPDAVPGALDRGNSSPGTWITGLTADPDGIVHMVRNNVEATFAVTTDGAALTGHLPAPPNGFQLVAGIPTPYRFDGNIVRFLSEGSDVQPAGPLVGAASPECAVAADVATGTAQFTFDGQVQSLESLGLQPRESIAASEEYIALGLSTDSVVLRLSCTTGTIDRYELGSTRVIPDGPGASVDPTATAGMAEADNAIQMHHRPQAVAVSSGGHLAVGVDTGEVVIAR